MQFLDPVLARLLALTSMIECPPRITVRHLEQRIIVVLTTLPRDRQEWRYANTNLQSGAGFEHTTSCTPSFSIAECRFDLSRLPRHILAPISQHFDSLHRASMDSIVRGHLRA